MVLNLEKEAHVSSCHRLRRQEDDEGKGCGLGIEFSGLGALFNEEGSLWQSKIMSAVGYPVFLVRLSGVCWSLRRAIAKDEETWQVRGEKWNEKTGFAFREEGQRYILGVV